MSNSLQARNRDVILILDKEGVCFWLTSDHTWRFSRIFRHVCHLNRCCHFRRREKCNKSSLTRHLKINCDFLQYQPNTDLNKLAFKKGIITCRLDYLLYQKCFQTHWRVRSMVKNNIIVTMLNHCAAFTHINWMVCKISIWRHQDWYFLLIFVLSIKFLKEIVINIIIIFENIPENLLKTLVSDQ